MNKFHYPFSAIVGQQEFKLALLLNIIDPSIGGVLAIGDKGTGKTTLIRSLSKLLSDDKHEYPFVNLPIGASEDRVLGHVNLEKLINNKQEHVVPGLLAKAHLGCLYVDEINLLNDYLMDVLLDASASGGYFLEREGLSAYLQSKFCIIGSMNPEEGELRPQLKDRFGLSVIVKTNTNVEERLQIIKNRIQFDDHPSQFISLFQEQDQLIVKEIHKAKSIIKKVTCNDDVYQHVANLVIQHNVEGHRADILLIKTARAYAAYHGEIEVTTQHIDAIKHLVLEHRSNQINSGSNNTDNSQNNQNQNQSSVGNQSQENQDSNDRDRSNPNVSNSFKAINPQNKVKVTKAVSVAKNGIDASMQQNKQGQYQSGTHKVDIKKTVSNYVTTDTFELQHKKELYKVQKHIVLLLDSSGSMLKENVVAYAKGMIHKIITSEKTHKPKFSLVSIVNSKTEVLVSKSLESDLVLQALETLETGGKTYIVPAFKTIKELIGSSKEQVELTMVTDGKFNSENTDNAFQEAVLGFKMYCKSLENKKIIDAERGVVKLGLAQKFANKINASYEALIY